MSLFLSFSSLSVNLHSSLLHSVIILSYISSWNMYCLVTSSAISATKNATSSSSSSSFFFHLGQLLVPTPGWCSGVHDPPQHCHCHCPRTTFHEAANSASHIRPHYVSEVSTSSLQTRSSWKLHFAQQFLIAVRVVSLHVFAVECTTDNTVNFECHASRGSPPAVMATVIQINSVKLIRNSKSCSLLVTLAC